MPPCPQGHARGCAVLVGTTSPPRVNARLCRPRTAPTSTALCSSGPALLSPSPPLPGGSLVKMQTHELSCVPGFSSHVPGIQIGTYVSADATDEHLQM